jgi:hypothetical protein
MRPLEKYAGSPGFFEVSVYLYDRYHILSDQYRSTRRYVSPHRDNQYTFSDEFANIVIAAGVVFGSAMHQLLKVADRAPKDILTLGITQSSCWMRFRTFRPTRFASALISIMQFCCPSTA